MNDFSRKSAVSAAISLTLIGLSGGALAASAPFSFDNAPGRLPKDVAPLAYEISITPDLEGLRNHGSERVTLNVRKATDKLVFNSLNETLRDVLVDGQPVRSTVSDDKAQLTTITLQAPLSLGRHQLTFAYDGRIETAPVGLFSQPYQTPDGIHGTLLTTQFEATDARRMFPCWDEPAFRAAFTLTVTVPADWQVVGNTPVASRLVHGKLATTRFQTTPKMPSYLVEFTGGNLGRVKGNLGKTELSVWAVKGQESKGKTALSNAKEILSDYNDYFGVPFPLPKLDAIAVPGGFTGAMENWGAITYNDQTLLLGASSSLSDRQLVYNIQAHEMAHQWNGDLVTMGWWDDIWLNESFASWRAAKQTADRNPDWRWWEVEDATKESAMDADARMASHPIEQHVTNELEATSAFDGEITYSKGQSVLRMLEAYLGPDVFREGIRTFMKTHAFGNASSADLWAALSQAAHRDVPTIAASWTEQAGFPLVRAVASCDAHGQRRISLSQERFVFGAADQSGKRWSVPLQVRVGTEDSTHAVLLTKDGQVLEAGRCDQTLSLNANAIGYYRVAYDEATLALNTQHFSRLPWADRIALLDDQWALVQNGVQPLPSYLALVSAMGKDVNERAWKQILEALSIIERAERGTAGYEAFTNYARQALTPVAGVLGWTPKAGEAPGVTKLRQRILTKLGFWGDAATVAEARKRFALLRTNPSALGPEEQGSVLSIVARHANESEFDQLLAYARASTSDQTTMRRNYQAVMDVSNPDLAKRAANVLINEPLPKEAESLRLTLLIELSGMHPTLAWQVLAAHTSLILAPFQPFDTVYLAQELPPALWDAIPLDEMETWIKARVPADLAPGLARGMETARWSVKQRQFLINAMAQTH